MKRLFAVVLLAGGIAATAVPAAHAAPPCGPIANVNCASGGEYCRVWVAATRTCVHT